MIHTPDAESWFKSSHSNNTGGQCVEGSRIGTEAMAVRDSKDPSRGFLSVSSASWSSLTNLLKQG